MKEKTIYINGVQIKISHEFFKNPYDGSIMGEGIKVEIVSIRVMDEDVDFAKLPENMGVVN